jgi:Ca2+-binding EF-hand superfamily protein
MQLKWEEVRSIFNTLDKDGDRNVNWEEFFVSIHLSLEASRL